MFFYQPFASGNKTDTFLGEALLSRSRLIRFCMFVHVLMHFSLIPASIRSATRPINIYLKTKYPTHISRQVN